MTEAVLTLHVQPGAKRTEVAGRHGDAIRIRVAAPPMDGAANAELVRYLADLFDLPRRAVRIEAGTGSRRKIVPVDGLTRAAAEERLLENFTRADPR